MTNFTLVLRPFSETKLPVMIKWSLSTSLIFTYCKHEYCVQEKYVDLEGRLAHPFALLGPAPNIMYLIMHRLGPHGFLAAN